MTAGDPALDRKIDAAGWGVFFLWVGIALTAKLGWGVGLIGVAVIMLGAQLVRAIMRVRVNGFSLIIGLLFAIVGVWNIFQVRFDLVPILFIVVGIAFLFSTWRRPRARGRAGPQAPAQV